MSHMSPLPLERIDHVDGDFYRSYVARARPVVITGMARSWGAVEKWSLAYMRDRWGANQVVVERRRGAPSDDPVAYLSERYYETHPLGVIIDGMLAGTQPPGTYITYADARSSIPGYEEDTAPLHLMHGFPARLPRAAQDALSKRPGLWVGMEGTVSPLHFDRQENFNVQVAGRKRWLLFPPSQSACVYMGSPDTPAEIFSPVDVEQPDLQRFPLFARATPLEAVLAPGDVIFVPSGWWHHVRSVEASITLNYWWWSLPACRTMARLGYHFLKRQARALRHGDGATRVTRMPTD